MNWFTRLFRRKPTLVGQRVHAWHWTQRGRREIEGEVVDEDDYSLYIDPSEPDRQEWRVWRRVWRHDVRLADEPLPMSTLGVSVDDV